MSKFMRRALAFLILFVLLFNQIPSPYVFVMAEEDSAVSESDTPMEEQLEAIAEAIQSRWMKKASGLLMRRVIPR